MPDIMGLSQIHGGGILVQHSNVLQVFRLCKGQNLSWNLPRDTPCQRWGDGLFIAIAILYSRIVISLLAWLIDVSSAYAPDPCKVQRKAVGLTLIISAQNNCISC